MKREEQIMNDPNLSAYTDKQRGWINEAFMDGVRWADESMIRKACEWLSRFLDSNVKTPMLSDEHTSDAIDIHKKIRQQFIGEIIHDFIKAMEGEQQI